MFSSGDSHAESFHTDIGPAESAPLFRSLAIVGVGLIGGSLGLALKARGVVERVLGVDCSGEVVARAQALGAIDAGSTEFDLLGESDCVVFASSVGGLPDLMRQVASFIPAEAVVTDVGSLKRRIVVVGEELFDERFVGGHPMAGSENSGIEAAKAELFEGAPWALVTSRSDDYGGNEAQNKIVALVTALGGNPVYLTPARHDHLVALVSHLPHALSFAYAKALAETPAMQEAVQLAGGSYRDMTRIARSSPNLWADILLENREEVLPSLAAFEASLLHLRTAIESGDREKVITRLRQMPKG